MSALPTVFHLPGLRDVRAAAPCPANVSHPPGMQAASCTLTWRESVSGGPGRQRRRQPWRRSRRGSGGARSGERCDDVCVVCGFACSGQALLLTAIVGTHGSEGGSKTGGGAPAAGQGRQEVWSGILPPPPPPPPPRSELLVGAAEERSATPLVVLLPSTALLAVHLIRPSIPSLPRPIRAVAQRGHRRSSRGAGTRGNGARAAAGGGSTQAAASQGRVPSEAAGAGEAAEGKGGRRQRGARLSSSAALLSGALPCTDNFDVLM